MLASTPCSTAARARSSAAAATVVAAPQARLLSRLATAKTSEAGTQTPSDAPKNAKAVKSADLEDFTWLKAQTPVKVFSGAQYVENYLSPPLAKAGFTNVQFVEPRLDKYTASLAQDTPIVCLFVNDECTEPIVAKLAKGGVKLIAMRCAGYDRVDLAACEKYGIKVARVPTYSPTSVAEHALALLFALNRRINIAYTRVMAGNYSLGPLVGMELRGKTVAVIGTGAIGTEAIRLFKGIGMNVMAYDVAKNPAVEALGVPYMSIEDMLPIADVVSLHVPLLPSTYHIMNKPRFAMMKKGALLLNVSRGGLVDSDEMMHALEAAQLGGVGLDVWENEADMFFTDWTDMDLETRMKAWDRKFYALTSFPQVIVTPHSAFLTHEALANIASTTVGNMEAFLLNKPLKYEIKAEPRISPIKPST